MSASVFEELRSNTEYYQQRAYDGVRLECAFREFLQGGDLEHPEGVSVTSSTQGITYTVPEKVTPEVHEFIVRLMELFDTASLKWRKVYGNQQRTARLEQGPIRVTFVKHVACKGKRYRVTTVREIVVCGDAPEGAKVEFLGEVDD